MKKSKATRRSRVRPASDKWLPTFKSYYRSGMKLAMTELRNAIVSSPKGGKTLAAAYSKGAAEGFLLGGFVHLRCVANERAATQWLRIVLSAVQNDLKTRVGSDIDIFMVEPGRTPESAGGKVTPRLPRTPQEKQAQVNAVICGLDAAAVQLRQVSLHGAADGVVEVLRTLKGMHRKWCSK